MAIEIYFDNSAYPGAHFTHPVFPIHGECTDFVEQEGVHFYALILIDKGLYTSGGNVTFNWGDISKVMSVDSYVDVLDYGDKLIDDAAEFALWVSRNNKLNRDFYFIITFDDAYYTTVAIYAREVGIAYNLDIISSTGAITYLSTTDGVDLLLNNRLIIYCDIFKKLPASVHKLIGTVKSNLVYTVGDPAYQFYFNLAEYLHRTLKCEPIDYNDYSNNGIIVPAELSCADYVLGIRQNNAWNGSLTLDSYTILRGGITKRDYMIVAGVFFLNYVDSVIWRLINQIKEASSLFWNVCKGQKIFASFFYNLPKDYPYVDYDLKIEIIDVSNVSGSTIIGPFTINTKSKYTIQYSYNDLDIAGIATSLSLGAVKSWVLKLVNVDTTEEFLIDDRVLVDDDYRQQFLIFENSNGGFQTIRTIGEFDYGIEIDKAEFDKTIPVLNLVQEDFMVSETYGHVFKGEIFSGWLYQEDMMAYLDLLNSENIWIQDEAKQAMVPIKILKNSYSIFKKSNTGVMQYGYKFQYVETANDKHITDLINI